MIFFFSTHAALYKGRARRIKRGKGGGRKKEKEKERRRKRLEKEREKKRQCFRIYERKSMWVRRLSYILK